MAIDQRDCEEWSGFEAGAVGVAVDWGDATDLAGGWCTCLGLFVSFHQHFLSSSAIVPQRITVNPSFIAYKHKHLSFRILPLSSDAGLIETIPDAISVHSIKKHAYAQGLNQPGLAYTLYDYFVREFGGGSVGGERWRRAQDSFMRSLAGYCVVCYLLGVKDRLVFCGLFESLLGVLWVFFFFLFFLILIFEVIPF